MPLVRACFERGLVLSPGAAVALSEASFRHVVQVCRLREGDSVLLLNGLGQVARATLVAQTKRGIAAQISDVSQAPAPRPHDSAWGIPKKDALDLMVKMAVELGLRRVYLVRGSHSQERLPGGERLEALIASAVEQSNSTWPTEFEVCASWDQIPWANYQHALCFDPRGTAGESLRYSENDSILTLIGPEAGFAPEELNYFQTIPQLVSIALPTPILRAPTALGMSAGWVTGRLGSLTLK